MFDHNKTFSIGDKVEQTAGGYNTDERDNGNQAIVTAIGLRYLTTNDGIIIETIGDWHLHTETPRGDGGFKLIENKKKTKKEVGEGMIDKKLLTKLAIKSTKQFEEKYFKKAPKKKYPQLQLDIAEELTRIGLEQLKDLIELLTSEELPPFADLRCSFIPFCVIIPIACHGGHNYRMAEPIILYPNTSTTFYRGDGTTGNHMDTQVSSVRMPTVKQITELINGLPDEVVEAYNTVAHMKGK